MKSPLHNLLQSEAADEIIAFLRSRGERAHIIAPEWVRARALGAAADAADGPAGRWSVDAQPRSALPAARLNFIVVAEDAAQEEALRASVPTQKGDRVYGLFRHVFPALLCGVNGMAPGQPNAVIKRFALLCIPRSGSRYLAAVLSNRGIGAAKEHIREPLANTITEGGLGFPQAVTALERFGQLNNIFGTKLISTFVIKASHRRVAELEENFAWMVDRGYQFVRLERPLKEAVVSSYIAFLMKKWHFFGELDERSRAKLDSLVFESGAAWEEYIRFRAEHIVINSLAAPRSAPIIRYSEIETAIDDVVERICEAIGVNQQKLETGSARVPLSTRSVSPTYARFAQQLDDLLYAKRNELEARTIKKLRTLTSLSSQRAEILFAESCAREASLV